MSYIYVTPYSGSVLITKIGISIEPKKRLRPLPFDHDLLEVTTENYLQKLQECYHINNYYDLKNYRNYHTGVYFSDILAIDNNKILGVADNVEGYSHYIATLKYGRVQVNCNGGTEVFNCGLIHAIECVITACKLIKTQRDWFTTNSHCPVFS